MQFNRTGAVNAADARGHGRSDAVPFTEEGADIIGFDLCDHIASAHRIRDTRPLRAVPRAFPASGGDGNV
jgi:hypothetical protein